MRRNQPIFFSRPPSCHKSLRWHCTLGSTSLSDHSRLHCQYPLESFRSSSKKQLPTLKNASHGNDKRDLILVQIRKEVHNGPPTVISFRALTLPCRSTTYGSAQASFHSTEFVDLPDPRVPSLLVLACHVTYSRHELTTITTVTTASGLAAKARRSSQVSTTIPVVSLPVNRARLKRGSEGRNSAAARSPVEHDTAESTTTKTSCLAPANKSAASSGGGRHDYLFIHHVGHERRIRVLALPRRRQAQGRLQSLPHLRGVSRHRAARR